MSQLPRLIVQVGRPRTASTYQFMALCVIQLLRHDYSNELVGCSWVEILRPTPFRVIKTHNFTKEHLRSLCDNMSDPSARVANVSQVDAETLAEWNASCLYFISTDGKHANDSTMVRSYGLNVVHQEEYLDFIETQVRPYICHFFPYNMYCLAIAVGFVDT